MFSTCIFSFFFFFFVLTQLCKTRLSKNPRRSLIIHDWGVFSLLWSCSALPSAGLRGQGSAADRNVFFASAPRRLAQGEGDFFLCFFGGEGRPAFLSDGKANRGVWSWLACPDAATAGPYKAPHPFPSHPVQSRPVPSHAALRCGMQTPACRGRSTAAGDSPPFIL